MLKTAGNAGCISLATLEEERELLQSKIETKNAKAKLEEQLAEASKWGRELAALVGEFESMGIEKADEQNRSTQADFERAKQEELQLRGDLKFAGGEKHVLEDQRKKLIQNKNRIQEDLKKEERNKPAFPVSPGPPPRQPSKPRGSYKTDPKTQERKYVPPSDREERDYQEELKLSKTYSERVAKFQKDSAEYPAKVQRWEANLAALRSQINTAEMNVASIEKKLKEMQEEIKQGIGKDLKQTGDQLDQLERLATLSSIAYKHVASNDPKSKNLFRPSNFRILDYESECLILRKSLR
jgi:chromosome segregation ATPase